MKVLLLSSSSGGHIYPSLAFGNYLEKKGHDVMYLGFINRMEEKIIPSHKLITLNCQNSFIKVIKNPFELIKFVKEIKKIKQYKYDAYVGFGGFISLVSIFIKCKNPLFIHEQNTTLGDSNMLLRSFSKKVFYTFENDDKKGVLVGNPSGENINTKEFSYKNHFKILFIFGSLGSSSLIEKLLSFENQLDKKNEYTLVIGSELFNKYHNSFKNVKVKEYISLKDELNNFDIVISRGGATSLYEIISSNTYCISIPSPYVKHNHQEKNVDYLCQLGLIDKLKEKDFTIDKLTKKINAYIDFDYCMNKYKKMNEFNSFNSSSLMLDEIKKYVKN